MTKITHPPSPGSEPLLHVDNKGTPHVNDVHPRSHPQPLKFRIQRKGPALGDVLLAALATNILGDQGFAAFLDDDRPTIVKHVEVPRWSGNGDARIWRFSYRPESAWDGRSIMRKALDNFAELHCPHQHLEITRTQLKVHMVEEPTIRAVDVLLCTQTGYWSPYRNWPHFPELKRLLDIAGATWHDLSASGTIDNECLNYAAKARVYVGLECGVSHFVASVVKNGIILQSGYSDIHYWGPYKYKTLSLNVPCQRCFLTYKQKCPNGHYCMADLTAKTLFDEIMQILAPSSSVRQPKIQTANALPSLK